MDILKLSIISISNKLYTMKKIAIHHRSGSYSDRWITYCDKKNIAYKIVNAFDNSIIKQLEDCDALLWHHNHISYKDVKVAKKILFALEHAGVKIFPDFKTAGISTIK